VVDTLLMARDLHPGKRNNLDALCERYQIDNSARTLHGAQLDARLLAEVYLSMTRGQESLVMDVETVSSTAAMTVVEVDVAKLDLVVVKAGKDELAEHVRLLAEIDRSSQGACLWTRLDKV
jgi:DNA polymerase-3 subunit epsilon